MSSGISESVHATEILTTTLFHELRIPISSINGYSSVLLSGELGRMNPGQRQTVRRIQELCQSVISLIGNLLVLVRSGARTTAVSREFVDVAQAAREVSRALEGEIRRKKIRFSVRLPARAVRFWGDMGGLTQIFLNLLSNAVKFTPPRGASQICRLIELELVQMGPLVIQVQGSELKQVFRSCLRPPHARSLKARLNHMLTSPFRNTGTDVKTHRFIPGIIHLVTVVGEVPAGFLERLLLLWGLGDHLSQASADPLVISLA